MRMLVCVWLGVASATAMAQGKTDYTLNDGRVHFRVPPTWTALMEKADGDPQAIAFQIPDDAAQGSDDTASVTVKTRQLPSPSAFAAAVEEDFEHARAQPGFENDASNKDTSVHQYFAQRARTRYVVRDSARLLGTIAVQVRCQRPLLDATPASWIASFEDACRAVTASLQP